MFGGKQRAVKRFLVSQATTTGRTHNHIVLSDMEFAAEHFGLPLKDIVEGVLGDPEWETQLFTADGHRVEVGSDLVAKTARAAHGIDNARISSLRVAHMYRPEKAPRQSLAKRLAKYGAVGYLLSRTWTYLMLLLKLGGKGKSLWSMLFMVGVYAMFWGWKFAVGFVLLLFVHEMGHAYVLRREGIKAGLPVFIPFMGAVIAMKELPRNAWQEAKVGIGGPVLGTIGALLCVHIHALTGDLLWQALAYTGFMLNLFNMLPVSPMDGGRVIGGVSRWLLVVGYVIGWAFFVFIDTIPLLLIILLVGGMEIWHRFKTPVKGYDDILPWQRVTMGVSYVALTAFLMVTMHITHVTEDQMTAAQAAALNLGPAVLMLGELLRLGLGREARIARG